jgi:molybdopterin converting factor small subunit
MRLYLGGFLSFYSTSKQEKLEIPLEKKTPLRVLLDSLGIPVSNIYLSVVNGEQVAVEEAVVQDGDEVHLYPPIDGG